MSKLRIFATGLISGILLVGGVSYARDALESVTAIPYVSYSVDGRKLAEQPVTLYHEGVVYAPVRFLASALHKEAVWEAEVQNIDLRSRQPILYREVEEHEQSKELRKWVAAWSKERYAAIRTIAGRTYLLAAAGAKPSGGYRFEAEELHVQDDQIWRLYVYESPPDKEELVTEEWTYPYVLLEIERDWTADAVIWDVSGGRTVIEFKNLQQ